MANFLRRLTSFTDCFSNFFLLQTTIYSHSLFRVPPKIRTNLLHALWPKYLCKFHRIFKKLPHMQTHCKTHCKTMQTITLMSMKIFGRWKVSEIRCFAWFDVTIYELRVTSYKLRVGNFLCELRVIFFEFKIKITSCQSILRVASYYSRVMSYFLRVANKNYELQVMALFHLKKKLTKHSEDRKSLLPV